MKKITVALSVCLSIVALPALLQGNPNESASNFDPLDWKRPVDNPIFTSAFGNNHDSILLVEPEQEYPYFLIVSHTGKFAQLWRTKKFSWNSDDWELVDGQYKIGNYYEYDDAVKVDGTYYLYEGGKVFTYTGPLETSSGKWKVSGKFPKKECDDIGVFLETAHPIKFSESVEKIINKKVVIPERIKKVLEGKKKSIEISSYNELKNFIIKN